MVWGGIAYGVKSQFIVVEGTMTAVGYRDEIFCPDAVPLVRQRQLILQRVSARPHVTRVCRYFLANNSILSLDWPPGIQHRLSPIEHLWDDLDRRVRKRQGRVE